MTFESSALSWLATVAVVQFKGSGYRQYESICRVHLVPTFGDMPIESISAEKIQEYIAKKVEGGLSPRTVVNQVKLLGRVMEYAVTCGLVTENPVARVKLPRQERAEMRFLTPEQVHDLIESTPPSWRVLIAMAALTGLRKGEQLALTFGDIDLENGVITVSKTMRSGAVSSPKTATSSGVVPLPESLIPMLEERRKKAPDPDGLVFCRRDGSALPDSLPNRILAKAVKAAGLPDIRWHDLRHSWVVAHLKAGTDIPTLQRLGRWKSADVLLSTYAHVLPAAGGDAVRRLDELVGGTELTR